ncbi:probable methyltransferase PMT23 [Andrographis paniculata]|uniref:probable methyltransferase PMT23 n=1 Tax=Andrographis paniculata TaxID=175694 RepID=UPI0021E92E16|nr:probable methyltransferase PMT23 [Andrographis paniculata]
MMLPNHQKIPLLLASFLLLFLLLAFLLVSDSPIPFPIAANLPRAADHHQSHISDQSIAAVPSANASTETSTHSPSPSAIPPINTAVSDDLRANESQIPSLLSNTSIHANNNSAIANTSSNPTANQTAADVKWKLCTGPVAVDYIPCLDNWSAIKRLKSRKRMEHRERHCPLPSLRCLVPLPNGYKIPVTWPQSKDMIWYNNVPHPKLIEYKKDQRWVARRGEYFYFPGGGTQFRDGVKHYIESIEKTLPRIEWGKRIRVVLDVGCGVASFGGELLDENVITMSMAPKDEHEAQIQFALERGIPAILAVIGTQRLPFPDNSFDLIHCARCRVHWDADGGKPLLELNRLLRPGGYFIWSATPVYQKDERHVNTWQSMVDLTQSLCWTTVAKTYFPLSHIGLAIYQKPNSSSCYKDRNVNKPTICNRRSKLNTSWYAPLDNCIVPFEDDSSQRVSVWPKRLTDKPMHFPNEPDSEETFKQDSRHWFALVSEVYLGALGLNWTRLRNVMDMNAGYGGFAAALVKVKMKMIVWVMNVIPIHEPDTLPIIYDRGLIGIYHDWCESFNTYPRTYDLLHASFLFENLTKRCDAVDVAVEIDRVLRPEGYLVVQDNMELLTKLNSILESLHWSTNIHQNQFLVGKKGFWRPPH